MPVKYEKRAYKNAGFDYEEYMKSLLYDVLENYPSREEYLAEIVIPFLKSVCPKGAKVVPVFADRNVGPKNNNNERMKTICAADGDEYVVPDLLIVPEEYSYKNPVKPLVMIETKKPLILNLGEDRPAYKDVLKALKSSDKMKEEVKTEIKACDTLIFTDCITWAFLSLKDGEIVEDDKYDTIRLLSIHKTDYVNPKTNCKWPGYKIAGDHYEEGEEPEDYKEGTVGYDGWDKLQDQIWDLVSKKLS